MQLVYHEYGVLVNNKDAQHAESDWLTVQTAQKHDQLQTWPTTIHIKHNASEAVYTVSQKSKTLTSCP